MGRGGCAPVAAAWELLPFPSSALCCRRCGKGAQKPSAACQGLIHLLLIVKVEFVPYQTAGSCCKTWPSSRQGWGLAPRSDASGDAAEQEKPLGFGFPHRSSLPLLGSAVPRAGPGGTELPPAPAPSPPPPSPQPPRARRALCLCPSSGVQPGELLHPYQVPASGTRPWWELLAAPRGSRIRARSRAQGEGFVPAPHEGARSKEPHACTNTAMPSGAGGGCLFPRFLISLCSSLASSVLAPWGAAGCYLRSDPPL